MNIMTWPKAITRIVLLTILGCSVFYISGCSEAVAAAGGTAVAAGGAYLIRRAISDIPVKVVNYAGYEAAVLGVKALPEGDRLIAARALVLLSQSGIEYIAGQPTSAEEINQWLIAQFGNVDPLVFQFISQAASTLTQYVAAGPNPLTDTEKALVTAFLQGLQDGAKAYIANPMIKVEAKYTTSKEVDKANEKAKKKNVRWLGKPGWFERRVEIIDVK